MQQSVKLNLEVDNKKKVTDYAFKVDTEDSPIINFRLVRNTYDYDLKGFNSLYFKIVDEKDPSNMYTVTITSSSITSQDGENVIKFIMPLGSVRKQTNLIVSPTIKISNISKALTPFKIIVYEKDTPEMNFIKVVIKNFNDMYGRFVDVIKRDQINQPDGVVGLNNNIKIENAQIPNKYVEHPDLKIRQSTVHGMGLNSDFMLEYKDIDDDMFYEFNLLFGGIFGYPNKSEEHDVYGGDFGENSNVDAIYGGDFIRRN